LGNSPVKRNFFKQLILKINLSRATKFKNCGCTHPNFEILLELDPCRALRKLRHLPTQYDLLELLERPTIEALIRPDQLYETNEWELVVKHPEHTRFDRKSSRIAAQDLAICLSAFGNGPAVEGGVVAIGIENDGRIAGCSSLSSAKLSELESMGRDHCHDGRFVTRRLGVTNSDGQDDFIILARVYYVEERLVELTNGTAYCREADRSRRLSDTEKQEVRINKGERAFELEPCPLNFPDEFRIKDIRKFARLIREQRDGSDDVSDEHILVSMRLGKFKGETFVPNNVCALMFAVDPKTVFPGAYVHFLRFNGTEEKSGKEYNVIKDRMIDGTVLDVIRDSTNTLDANLREFTIFERGKFHQIPEYPHDAWYELIVNACVHRSYHAKTQPIFVKMFDDHLVVESPGGFMPSVTPENLFHKPRNPFLMFVLREYGEVRCISEGTKRIKRELNEAKLPPAKYSGTGNNVTATLQNDIANRSNSLDSEAYKIIGEVLAFSLDGDEKKIINLAIEHGKVNVSDALRILATTRWHTARAKLKRLEERGILSYESSKARDPNAHWIIRRSK